MPSSQGDTVAGQVAGGVSCWACAAATCSKSKSNARRSRFSALTAVQSVVRASRGSATPGSQVNGLPLARQRAALPSIGLQGSKPSTRCGSTVPNAGSAWQRLAALGSAWQLHMYRLMSWPYLAAINRCRFTTKALVAKSQPNPSLNRTSPAVRFGSQHRREACRLAQTLGAPNSRFACAARRKFSVKYSKVSVGGRSRCLCRLPPEPMACWLALVHRCRNASCGLASASRRQHHCNYCCLAQAAAASHRKAKYSVLRPGQRAGPKCKQCIWRARTRRRVRLTIRSSGAPSAGHRAREAVMFIISLAGPAPCRCRPLSSNVRWHETGLVSSVCKARSIQLAASSSVSVPAAGVRRGKSPQGFCTWLSGSAPLASASWLRPPRVAAKGAGNVPTRGGSDRSTSIRRSWAATRASAASQSPCHASRCAVKDVSAVPVSGTATSASAACAVSYSAAAGVPQRKWRRRCLRSSHSAT